MRWLRDVAQQSTATTGHFFGSYSLQQRNTRCPAGQVPNVTDNTRLEARFRQLHDAAYTDVLRFVQRRAGPHDAEDIVADAYLVAWRRAAEIPTDADGSRAWLFGIARNCLLNARRATSRRAALTVRIADHAPTATPPTDVAALVDVAAAWRQLTPEHQEALALSVYEGLTSAHAAKVLGITAVAFRLRLRAARKHLTALTAVDISTAATPGKVCHD